MTATKGAIAFMADILLPQITTPEYKAKMVALGNSGGVMVQEQSGRGNHSAGDSQVRGD